MAFEIGWLESARRELDAEIEYVYSEFGGNRGQAPVPVLKISKLRKIT